MWCFEFDEEKRQWCVSYSDAEVYYEKFYLEERYDAVILCGVLNKYELEKIKFS